MISVISENLVTAMNAQCEPNELIIKIFATVVEESERKADLTDDIRMKSLNPLRAKKTIHKKERRWVRLNSFG